MAKAKKVTIKNKFPEVIYVRHVNPGTDDEYYSAEADAEDLLEKYESVQIAKYELVATLSGSLEPTLTTKG